VQCVGSIKFINKYALILNNPSAIALPNLAYLPCLKSAIAVLNHLWVLGFMEAHPKGVWRDFDSAQPPYTDG